MLSDQKPNSEARPYPEVEPSSAAQSNLAAQPNLVTQSSLATQAKQSTEPTQQVQLFPAIDLLGGRVVRLKRGDYDQVTVYHDDPVAQAVSFAEAGAQWLHVVDLDAARDAGQDNRQLIARIIAESGLKVEVGGGVRSLAAIEWLAQNNAARVIMGTSLIADRPLVEAAIDCYPDLICAAIDARDGLVAIAGWQQTVNVEASQLAAELASLGIRHFLYTDINRDGLQTGIDVSAYRQLSQTIGVPVIVSGGIASLADIQAVSSIAPYVEAVIVGRALYERNFTIPEALAVLTSEAVPGDRTVPL
ncbi:MAG: 1-(5-phosphoribosyl)-5-[(5-phosphoribosylamino)methylideneamino]imidazole-4-carboxamide isomerase [Coriobacteriales bacterium]|jgi:phosphoribosylformimino-5-aminoimidazole carboxamide ribotide isomerase|nr:1-(5-phosphoribosyl)-5-[(5-phosphoribosylamino)methylideneamino]imidazole-4-carboxamide isomerase [Coriobacteriales bacterium]